MYLHGVCSLVEKGSISSQKETIIIIWWKFVESRFRGYEIFSCTYSKRIGNFLFLGDQIALLR